MKTLRILEALGYAMWGVNVFELIAIQSIGHIERFFPSLNSDMVTIATIFGLLMIILNGWIRLDSHLMKRKLDAANLRKLENESKQTEEERFTFKRIIESDEFKPDFDKSAERLK